jgi:Phage major capsid protein E
MEHIGLAKVAPFLDVQSDDVIFAYAMPEVDGLAPARAEDSESELAQKDDSVGTGRASVIDWALKDHYDPSDVTRYREFLRLAELAAGGGDFPLTMGTLLEDFPGKVARDTARRKRKLDNRIEWLIMGGVDAGQLAYNDGKIKFTTNYGRPGDQQNQAPAGGLWTLAASDPIGDFMVIDQLMYDRYGFRFSEGGRAIGSRKAWQALLNSDKWAARAGIPGSAQVPVNPNYLIDGWGKTPNAVMDVYARQTGLSELIIYDAVYRTRAQGSTTTVNTRFTSEKNIIFLPPDAAINEADDTEIGFAKTLTSPHAEGGWTSGYYEWEKDTGPDPWGQDVGTGIKAFPVFPHLEFSYVMTVLP